MGVIRYVGRFLGVVVLGLFAIGLFMQSSQAMAFGNETTGWIGIIGTLVVIGVVLYLKKGL